MMEGLFGAVTRFAVSAGPALLMLSAFLLAAAGVRMILRGENRQKAVLMIVCAIVFIANVLIWTL